VSSPFSFSVGVAEKQLEPEYDVVVIGGGPAGLAAAIYSARALLKTAVLSKDFGGQVLDAHVVENYPGFVTISGRELMEKFREHAEKMGANLVEAEVVEIKKEGEYFIVVTSKGETRARALIFATGSRHRRLGVPGEKELEGKGVSYCAICDAALFRNKVVAVVGGGNTAFMDAELLSEYAKKVYIIHRRTEFRAEPVLVERLRSNPKVEFIVPYVVERIVGKEKVEGVVLKHRETGEKMELTVDGVFIDVGMIPQTDLLRPLGVELDERGYVLTKEDMSTNISGLFAAGDVARGCADIHQIITAAAKGAVAAISAYRYLKEQQNKRQ